MRAAHHPVLPQERAVLAFIHDRQHHLCVRHTRGLVSRLVRARRGRDHRRAVVYDPRRHADPAAVSDRGHDPQAQAPKGDQNEPHLRRNRHRTGRADRGLAICFEKMNKHGICVNTIIIIL